MLYVDVVQSYNVFNVDNTIASEWTMLHKDAFIGCRELVPYRKPAAPIEFAPLTILRHFSSAKECVVIVTEVSVCEEFSVTEVLTDNVFYKLWYESSWDPRQSGIS